METVSNEYVPIEASITQSLGLTEFGWIGPRQNVAGVEAMPTKKEVRPRA
jgi:hypothetical protein